MSKLLITTVRFKHKSHILPPGSLIHVHDDDAAELLKAGHAEEPLKVDPFSTSHHDYKSDPVQMPECGSTNPFRTILDEKAPKAEVKSDKKEEPKAKKQKEQPKAEEQAAEEAPKAE